LAFSCAGSAADYHSLARAPQSRQAASRYRKSVAPPPMAWTFVAAFKRQFGEILRAISVRSSASIPPAMPATPLAVRRSGRGAAAIYSRAARKKFRRGFPGHLLPSRIAPFELWGAPNQRIAPIQE